MQTSPRALPTRVALKFLMLIALLGSLSSSCATTRREPRLERHEFRAAKMGTEFRLVLYAEREEQATRAAGLAWGRIDELEACMSDYRDDSELSLLPARSAAEPDGGWVSVSEDLWHVLSAAQEFSLSSAGAFDITVGPQVRLWRRARRQERAPSAEAIARAARSVGYRELELDPERQQARVLVDGMRLDLGGIAKGYALDEALRVLREEGLDAALIDGGGDVLAGSAPPGRDAWQVRIQAGGSDLTLELEHAAVATSGDAYRFVELDGVRYSHIVDPRTGWALAQQATVSVVAASGMRADAAASAASVLGPREGSTWLESEPNLAGRFLWLENDELCTCETTGFERMMAADSELFERSP